MLYGVIAPFSRVAFNPKTDIPDLSGKVILITGGNVGLGKETIRQLLLHNPSRIYLAARTASKAHSCIEELLAQFPSDEASPPPSLEFIQCDLSSLKSVQACAREFVSKEQRLDILLLNAGVMALPPGTTADGYEIQFGTNHVGHALLTKLLLPTLRKTAAGPPPGQQRPKQDGQAEGQTTEAGAEAGSDSNAKADVRVISLSSIGHLGAAGIGIPLGKAGDGADLKTDMRSYHTWRRYGISKLANILFTRELARREAELASGGGGGVLAAAVHPGVVNTELYTTYFSGWGPLERALVRAQGAVMTSLEDGAKNQLWAATAARAGAGAGEGGEGEAKGKASGGVKSGEYYTPVGVPGQGNASSRDMELARRLWEWTEKELEGWEL